jgi:hypothetical protein
VTISEPEAFRKPNPAIVATTTTTTTDADATITNNTTTTAFINGDFM